MAPYVILHLIDSPTSRGRGTAPYRQSNSPERRLHRKGSRKDLWDVQQKYLEFNNMICVRIFSVLSE